MLKTANTYNETQQEKKNRVRGIITSVVVHILLVLLLWFFGLPYLDPPPPDEGILVNFGLTETGMGDNPSEVINPVEEVAPTDVTPPPTAAVEEVQEEVITQEEEITAPVIKKEEKKKEVKKETPVVKDTKTEPVKETKEETKVEEPVVDKRALFTGKKSNTNNPNSQGEAGGPGDQGKPWGDPNSKNYGDGKGLGNSGTGFSLAGRSSVSLPKPNDKSQATGTVVVKIRVNKNGDVVSAQRELKGSTTSDPALIQAAVDAAKRAKFNADKNAQDTQEGTITYVFKVQ